jgi:hypothetical protein
MVSRDEMIELTPQRPQVKVPNKENIIRVYFNYSRYRKNNEGSYMLNVIIGKNICEKFSLKKDEHRAQIYIFKESKRVITIVPTKSKILGYAFSRYDKKSGALKIQRTNNFLDVEDYQLHIHTVPHQIICYEDSPAIKITLPDRFTYESLKTYI